MFNTHIRHRRSRRLLAAAVAAVTLAASAPLGAPSVAHAKLPAPRAVAQPPGKIPTLPRVTTTRGLRVQATSTT